MSKKPTAPKGTLLQQKGEWLYVLLMKDIESELCEDPVALEKRYAGETPTNHAARMEHYREAFAEFDRVLEMVTNGIRLSAEEEKKERRSVILQQESADHSAETTSAEHKLDTFPSQA